MLRTRIGQGVQNARQAIETLRRERALRDVVTGWSIGIAADQGFLVAALVAVYAAGGFVAAGLLGIVRMLPAVVVAFVSDVDAIRRPERVLVFSNGIRAVAAAAAAIVVLVAGPGEPRVAVAIAFCAAIVAGAGSLVRPTQFALLPALASSPEQLVAANVTMSTGEGVGSAIGPLLAGLLLALAGPAPAFVAVAVAFGLAGAMSRVRVAEAARPATQRRGGLPLVEGVRELARLPGPAVMILSFLSQAVVRGLLTTEIVLLSTHLLGLGDAGVGFLGAAIGIGGICGGLASLAFASSGRLAPVAAISLTAWGLPIAVIGLAPSVPVAVVALWTVGVANAALDVSGFTLLQRTIPTASRMRVLALFEGLIGVAVAAGSGLAPTLVGLLGPRGAVVLTGALLPVVAALGWRRLRRLDDESVVPEERGRLLRAVPLFHLLPLSGIERLAAGALPLTFEGGEALMAEGEPGDRYIVITRGEAEVSQAGRRVRRVGAGDGVGEIALLRQVPRTATVIADGPVSGLALDAATFLAAVTGHEPSARAATEMVERRLAR